MRLERVFQGPMDLLLHLVREQEVEIHEIEIHRVIRGYLDHLQAMRELDIEVAGDFLVMAATLMSIKSRSLLPRESVDLEAEIDPRDELIQRLIEYRRFKEASERLGEHWELRQRRHGLGQHPEPDAPAAPELDLGEITVWDLLAAFSRLMRETQAGRPHQVRGESRPLRHYVRVLTGLVLARERTTLRELVRAVEDPPTRESLIGAFCALLELVKLGVVGVAQVEPDGEVQVERRTVEGEDVEALLAGAVFEDEIAETEDAAGAAPPAADGAHEAPAGEAAADAERAG